ncbi:MAG: hypothetical protein JWQ98_2499 [Chlorobi bacterium]|nr:hypothetical protein [Chlorobiota bacterium]
MTHGRAIRHTVLKGNWQYDENRRRDSDTGYKSTTSNRFRFDMPWKLFSMMKPAAEPSLLSLPARERRNIMWIRPGMTPMKSDIQAGGDIPLQRRRRAFSTARQRRGQRTTMRGLITRTMRSMLICRPVRRLKMAKRLPWAVREYSRPGQRIGSGSSCSTSLTNVPAGTPSDRDSFRMVPRPGSRSPRSISDMYTRLIPVAHDNCSCVNLRSRL